MIARIKEIASHPHAAALEDAVGVASLFILLFAGLILSGAA